MRIVTLIVFMTLIAFATPKEQFPNQPVRVAGALRNVMHGDLSMQIRLDTIRPTRHLYGLGPLGELAGEILIYDGQSYIARVTSKSMLVERDINVAAPFLVYAHASAWTEVPLPETLPDMSALGAFLDSYAQKISEPFLFRLEGRVTQARIHLQNLPPGTKVRSPEDAHQGQENFVLENREVRMVGFFSRKHPGIFTHHDSYTHIHLITVNEEFMGHLDEVSFGNEEMKLLVATSSGQP